MRVVAVVLTMLVALGAAGCAVPEGGFADIQVKKGPTGGGATVAPYQGDPTEAGPAEAVQAYLSALTRGTAEEVLSHGVEVPKNRALLSDEILRHQQEQGAVTDLDLGEVRQAGGEAIVPATYYFGDTRVGGDFRLRKVDGRWKLVTTIATITPTVDTISPVAGLTYHGVDVSGRKKLRVFPGPIVWGTASPHLRIAETRDDFPALPGTHLEVRLRGERKPRTDTRIAELVEGYARQCVAATSLAPAGCPNNTDPGPGNEVIADTVAWTLEDPAQPVSHLRLTANPENPYLLDVTGSVKAEVTFDYHGFGGRHSAEWGPVPYGILGQVDLRQADLAFAPTICQVHPDQPNC